MRIQDSSQIFQETHGIRFHKLAFADDFKFDLSTRLDWLTTYRLRGYLYNKLRWGQL